jgi:hypothetical protein
MSCEKKSWKKIWRIENKKRTFATRFTAKSNKKITALKK